MEVLTILLSHNANPNIAQHDSKYTPMFGAAKKRHWDVVLKLLQSNADPMLPNKVGTGNQCRIDRL
jgi:hypothetical protein